MDNIAKNLFFVALDKDTFSKVKDNKTTKEIWDKLKMICEGMELSKDKSFSNWLKSSSRLKWDLMKLLRNSISDLLALWMN